VLIQFDIFVQIRDVLGVLRLMTSRTTVGSLMIKVTSNNTIPYRETLAFSMGGNNSGFVSAWTRVAKPAVPTMEV
jgi:hypothetical protein